MIPNIVTTCVNFVVANLQFQYLPGGRYYLLSTILHFINWVLLSDTMTGVRRGGGCADATTSLPYVYTCLPSQSMSLRCHSDNALLLFSMPRNKFFIELRNDDHGLDYERFTRDIIL